MKTLSSVIYELEQLDGEQWYIAYLRELGKYSCYDKGDTKEEAYESFVEEYYSFMEYLESKGNINI
jgi:hypothetical protein